jgi:hypothetical protein
MALDLSGFQQWHGISLATTVIDTTYDAKDPKPRHTVLDRTKFILQSKVSYALPNELFRPEHYLGDGDNVEYKIPKRAGENLDFIFHQNKGTIEDQANAQDLIVLSHRKIGR